LPPRGLSLPQVSGTPTHPPPPWSRLSPLPAPSIMMGRGCPPVGDPREAVTPLEDAPWHRTGSVSLGAIQPTWDPFGSIITHRRRLGFTLDVYDSSWSSRLHQPSYSLGELLNVQASISTEPPLPLKVFVDQCVASSSPVATWPRYKVIVENG
ncbi:ZP3 protein, partial [Thinocorus orbignyianus]|nr:ZP3 protein [Thinocorus orbignyianus]